MEALLLHDKGEYADKIIKSILDKYSYLERFERSFINRVFNGTIERKLSLDFVINQYSSVKINKQKPVIRAILRMSVYQLLYMDSVPDSAVINEAVKLAKKKKFNGLSGFVNGVLRKIAKEKDNIAYPDRDKNYSEYLSTVYSCPQWLCNHFISECGEKKAEEVLANSLKERPVIIRTNISAIDSDTLRNRLISEAASVTNVLNGDESIDAFILENIDGLSSLDSFNEGLYLVQDLSSQAVLLGNERKLIGEMSDDKAVKAMRDVLKNASCIVDVCAAPGGKTCHVADLLKYYGNDKCTVISRDVSDLKVDKIDENVERCGFDNVKTEVHDALVVDEKLSGKADLVIADLPCSGLGVIGRKTDIKYRIQPDELEALSNLQKDILRVVSQYVKEGGMLVFSTCTVNKSENYDNAKWVEDEIGFSLVCEPVQVLNDSIEHDGFFISRFVKTNK